MAGRIRSVAVRLLIVAYSYPPFLEFGGPALVAHALATGLAAREHSVTVLTAAHRPQMRAHKSHVDGVEVVRLRSLAQHRTVTFNPGALSFAKRNVGRFDVVHIFGFHDLLPPIVAMECHRQGIPYVLEPVGMVRPVARSFVKKRVHLELIGHRLLRDAERVVATSTLEWDDLQAAGVSPSRLTLRRNGVDLEEFRSLPKPGSFRKRMGIPADAPLVLFLGRMATKKHPTMLVAALAGAPKAHLAFVGPDHDGQAERVRETAMRLGMQDRVFVAGPLYGRERIEAFADADVFALPSEAENFGNTIAESMAAGTPVVVTEHCGIAPYVEGAGLVIPLRSDALRDAILRLLEDTDLRTKSATTALTIAEGFSWEGPIVETEALYEGILADSG